MITGYVVSTTFADWHMFFTYSFFAPSFFAPIGVHVDTVKPVLYLLTATTSLPLPRPLILSLIWVLVRFLSVSQSVSSTVTLTLFCTLSTILALLVMSMFDFVRLIGAI
jgi:hypothetical protein